MDRINQIWHIFDNAEFLLMSMKDWLKQPTMLSDSTWLDMINNVDRTRTKLLKAQRMLEAHRRRSL